MGVVDGNARDAMVIVKSDTALCNPYPVAIYVGVTGNIAVVTEGQWRTAEQTVGAQATNAAKLATITPITFTAVPAGGVINCRVMMVMSTNTTATNMVGYLP